MNIDLPTLPYNAACTDMLRSSSAPFQLSKALIGTLSLFPGKFFLTASDLLQGATQTLRNAAAHKT